MLRLRRVAFFPGAPSSRSASLRTSSGQIGFASFSRSVFDFALIRIFLAQLLLDRALLLAQNIFALLARHFAARFFGDLVAQLQHFHFMRKPAVHHAQRFQARRRFKQRLLARRFQVHDRSQHVGQPQRIFLRGEHPRQFLRRLVRRLNQPHELRSHLDDRERQRFGLAAGIVRNRQASARAPACGRSLRRLSR